MDVTSCNSGIIRISEKIIHCEFSILSNKSLAWNNFFIPPSDSFALAIITLRILCPIIWEASHVCNVDYNRCCPLTKPSVSKPDIAMSYLCCSRKYETRVFRGSSKPFDSLGSNEMSRYCVGSVKEHFFLYTGVTRETFQSWGK